MIAQEDLDVVLNERFGKIFRRIWICYTASNTFQAVLFPSDGSTYRIITRRGVPIFRWTNVEGDEERIRMIDDETIVRIIKEEMSL